MFFKVPTKKNKDSTEGLFVTAFGEMLSKRLRREVEQWTLEDERALGRLDVDDEDAHRVRIGTSIVLDCRTYPFSPPTVVRSTYRTMPSRANACGVATNALDALTWLVCLASHPPLRQRFPTFRIACLCCHSIRCPHNWSVSIRLVVVAHELLFEDRYLETLEELRGSPPLLFHRLTDELLECIAAFV